MNRALSLIDEILLFTGMVRYSRSCFFISKSEDRPPPQTDELPISLGIVVDATRYVHEEMKGALEIGTVCGFTSGE